jgi:hypothetical protein
VNVFIFAGILEDSVQAYTRNDHEKFKIIVQFDCRGLELIDFDFRVCTYELGVCYQVK